MAILPIPQGYPDMVWSPDGRYLSYVSEDKLYIKEMPSGGTSALTLTPIDSLTPVVLPALVPTPTASP